jgi:hypothetical protein
MQPNISRRLLWCGAFVCAALTINHQARADYASTVTSFNPVLYYHLNETASVPSDLATNSGSLGAAANGLYLGGATHPASGALLGSPDSAANFPDAAGNRVRVPWNPALAAAAPFTVEFWANPAALGSADSADFMCPVAHTQFGDPPGTGGFRQGWLFYQNAGNGWIFRIYGNANTAYSVTGTRAVVAAQWYHVVGVYDGAQVIIYVNGQALATNAAPSFVPVANSGIPFAIGLRSDGALGSFRYNGSVDEVAYYSDALPASAILAHYQNGISASPATPYDQVVQAQHPVAYYRLNEPTWSDPGTYPAAVNVGALGTGADGTFNPGVVAGVPGVPFSGFGANNYAAEFNSQLGSIAILPQGVTTDTLTITCWLKRRGTQNLGGLVMQRDGANANATGLQIWDGSNNDLRANWNDADWGTATALVPPDNTWTFGAMVITPTNTTIYMDDRSVTFNSTHAVHDFSVGNILIGQDAYSATRVFNGSIDEVAVFGTALTTAQINQLYYAGNVPPLVLTQPQAPVGDVIAGAPLTFTVLATGTPSLSYQWTKGGVALPNQTGTALTFANLASGDSGNYAVIVTNAYGATTSAVAALTVKNPTGATVLTRAVGYPAYNSTTRQATLTQVILDFSGPLAQASTNLGNFAIPGLTVSKAQFANLNASVILTTSAQTEGATYTVTVTGVTDGIGNPVTENLAQFRAWVASPANGVVFEAFNGNTTTVVADLTNNPAFPNYPALVTNLWGFDSRIIYADDTHSYFGARMSGIFTPSTSGNWRFFLRSDDSSQLFLNPSGLDPAGKILIAQDTSCCQDWNATATQSGLIALTAGQSYYLELLYKEGGGGDYGKVAARLDGTGTPPAGTANTDIDPASLAGPAIGYPYTPADAGGPLTVTGPSSLTVQANHPASFAVAATGPVGQLIQYQWSRNGNPIDGATGTSYSFLPTTADHNARFTVQVSKPGSVVTTPAAILSVTADTDVPTVALVRGSTSLKTVTVFFSEKVEVSQAQNPANYTIPGFTVTSAVLDAEGTTVTLTFNPPLAPNQNYNLTIQGVTDLTGHTLATIVKPLQSFVFSRGLLRFDYFTGLSPTDNSLDAWISSDPRFPNLPTLTYFVSGLDSRSLFPDDSHEAYGFRITGLFVPPTNGNYMFYVKSDDSARLIMNLDGADPENASVQWEKPAAGGGYSANATGPFPMFVTNKYYLEVLQKEGNGGDYVQVAQQIEGGPILPDALSPMAPAVVGVLADPAGASVTITKQPESTVAVYKGADEPRTALAADFNGNNGGFSRLIYGTQKSEFAPWAYDAARGSWSCSGSNACFGPVASALNSPTITMTNDGGVLLTFNHRYSFEGFTPSDGTAWDGGQVRISVNGGNFFTVPTANFSSNGYIMSIGGSIVTNLVNSPGWINAAWVGESPDYASGAYLTSVAALGYFNKGDTIVLQFVASWDDCTGGLEPNWEIDRVQVSVGAAVPAVVLLSVGAESTYQNQPNPFMSYFWQRNTGSGFSDLPGANSPICTLNLGLADSGASYRCIVYSPGSAATSAVATATVTLELKLTQPTANSMKLTWPLPSPLPLDSFLLEKSPTLAGGSWTAVPTSEYQTTSTSVSVNVVALQSGPGQYYRLRRQ